MKWIFCLSTLCLGLLTGRLASHWLRDDSDFSSPPGQAALAGGAASSLPDGHAAWERLMERARTESLQDLDMVLSRGNSGPLDCLGCIERSLSIWRAIEQGADAGQVSQALHPPGASGSEIRKARDWNPMGVSLSQYFYWHLGRKDPEGALKALGRRGLNVRGPIFAAWAETNPLSALRAVDENCEGMDRAYHTVTVLSALARRDPGEAIRLATKVRREGEDPVSGILQNLASNHPYQALDFIRQPGNGLTPDQTHSLVTESVGSLAGEKSGAHWEVLNQLADYPGLASVTAECLGGWAAIGAPFPSEALSILEKLPPEVREKSLVSGMAVALYRADPALADQMLAGLPEEAAGRAAEAAAAAAMKGGSINHPPDVQLGLGIASRLPYERQWELVGTWVGYGHSTPSVWEEWVSKVDDPQWHDRLAGKLATQFEKSDPASAVRLAASIGDETRREAALTASLTAWRAKDPAAAAAWEGGDPQ